MAGEEQRGPKHRRLAAALKAARIGGGLSADALGRRLSWSQSKVSKIENGRTKPTSEDVAAWLGALHAAPRDIAELVELARDVQVEARAWRDIYQASGGVDRRQALYAELDTRAERQEVFEPSMAPGLLQTADYARQVFAAALPDADPGVLARAAAQRVDRQAALYEGRMSLETVVTEAALRWVPGSVGVLAGQLDRVLSMMTLETVRVGVIPLGAGPPALTSFTIRYFADEDEPTLVTVELVSEEKQYVEPEDVAAYRAVFAEARKAAAFGEDARRELARIAGEYRLLG